MTHVTDVRRIEEIAARTWRGLEEERYGDWLLRAAGGFTGRANSVLAVGDPPAAADDAVAAVTRWYADRGLRPRAQVPMPDGTLADAAFARAGWSRDYDVLVMTAPLRAWPAPVVPVELSPVPDGAWLDGYRYHGAPLPPVAKDVLVNADSPVFASVRLAPSPAPLAAVARGVLVDGWLVVTAVTVADDHRRRGLARAVMGALNGWAGAQGASACVLQVARDNAPALALYARLGFTEHHRYHYRSAPA